MIVKLLTEHHLEFRSLKGGCRGSSESKLIKMSNCWKSHAAAHLRSLAKALCHKLAHLFCLERKYLVKLSFGLAVSLCGVLFCELLC